MTVRERLHLNRLGMGFCADALVDLRAFSSTEAWLSAQLAPESVREAEKVTATDSWFAALDADVSTKVANDRSGNRSSWDYGNDLANRTILRQVYSRRTLLERMTEIWSNHFHVSITHANAWAFRADYDETIRAHALGSFEDLLIACSLHPAMRLFLDNWRSVKGRPNENQGRELLELHTVGKEAGYTEAMVRDSAVLLSGFTVDWGRSYAARYDASAHSTGAVKVLGFTHANSSADGQAATVDYLRYLANHPSTALRVATVMARNLVSDTPSQRLVERLAGVYSDSSTSIGAVLRALVADPEFLGSEGLKIRTPVDDLVATARVLELDVSEPTSSTAWANYANYLHGDIRKFSWPRPDGAPTAGAAHASASRILASARMHLNQAGGYYPKGALYKEPNYWMPAPSVRFRELVDHLCRRWTGRPADARQQEAASQAVALRGDAVLTTEKGLPGWQFVPLACSLLDSPDFLTT